MMERGEFGKKRRGNTEHNISWRTMWLSLLVCQLALLHLGQAQNICLSHSTFRQSINSDITVFCGTERLELQILLCPVYYGGYNETLMSLNDQHSKEQCRGTPDWTADPPVLKFNFSITEEAVSACSNTLKVTQEVGTGAFADFSSVQFVNISGKIRSHDPNPGTITYRLDMMYKFSCRYPLQYLVNNTEISVSGTSLAVRDKNGSFISTLSMQLYSDKSYTSFLDIPTGGLELKTRIFVQVKATNLTGRFNVLLDRCYASTDPYPLNSSYHDLFVGCNRDGQTVIVVNGKGQEARFSFETFRWVQRQNRTLSVFFLHCVTRLCERSLCSSLRKDCSRRRREVQSDQGTSVSESATVSSGPLLMRMDKDPVEAEESGVAEQTHTNEAVVGVAIVAGVMGALCLSLLACITFRIYTSKHGFMDTRSLYRPE